MPPSRPWFGAGAHRAGATLSLSVISGAATAIVAALYLGSALSDVAHCRQPPSGAGCAAHPFWGFSPSLFLLVSILGVLAGVLTAVVGLVAVRVHRERTWLGFVVIALSGVGLLAYGGFGVGVVAGVLAGLWLSEPGGSRAPSPSEWSGSFPVGVPPPPRGAKRPIAPRPSVTEWDGIVASGPPNPASAGRPRVTLPSADRLAQALERSRQTAPRSTSPPDAPPPTVVLPPPPVGLRGPSRIGRPVGGSNGPSAGAPPVGRAPPASGPSPDSDAPSSGVSGRWQPARGEIAPWDPSTEGTGPSRAPSSAGPGLAPSSSRPPPPRVPAAQGPLRVPRGAPPPGPAASAPPTAASPPPTAPASPPPREPARYAAPSRPTAGRPVSVHASPGFSSSVAPPRAAPPRAPVPASPAPPPALAPPGAVAPSADRPPPPSGPLPKARTKAWRCANCKLVNPPWHHVCPRCHAPGPPVSG